MNIYRKSFDFIRCFNKNDIKLNFSYTENVDTDIHITVKIFDSCLHQSLPVFEICFNDRKYPLNNSSFEIDLLLREGVYINDLVS